MVGGNGAPFEDAVPSGRYDIERSSKHMTGWEIGRIVEPRTPPNSRPQKREH